MGLKDTLQGALTEEKESDRKPALSSEKTPERKNLVQGERENISVQM